MQIKEYVQQQTKGLHGTAVLYASFFVISFFGWILEVVFFLCKGSGLCDRGFLSLPLCPVYGLSAVFTYLLLGLPHRMRIGSIALPVRSSYARFRNKFFYLIGGALISTACELAVGLALDRGFGVVMWNYSRMPLQYGGYICLPFSFIWGMLITAFMQYLFLPLLVWLRHIKRQVLYGILLPLSFLFLADLAINSVYSFYTRTHLSIWM